MDEIDGTELDETIRAMQENLNDAAASISPLLAQASLPSLPPAPEPPKEFSLGELHSITLDAISWREASAQKTVQLANTELREVERMKEMLFKRAIMEFGIDTDKYSVTLNSKTRKIIATPKE